MKSEPVFLTIKEALSAVCLDLRQYEPQIPLMCEIIDLISAEEGSIIRDTHSGIWIRRKGRHPPRRFSATELTTHVCSQLTQNSFPLEIWIDICRRVFQTRVQKARDPVSGQWGLSIETGMEGYACRQCGQCCRQLDYRHELTAEDVLQWRNAGRDDILAWVAESRDVQGAPSYRIWIIPGTNQLAPVCPFLKQGASNHLWICSIHNVKPRICRQYPITRKHALMTGCIGFSKG